MTTRDEWVAICRKQLTEPIRRVANAKDDQHVAMGQSLAPGEEDGADVPAWLRQAPVATQPAP